MMNPFSLVQQGISDVESWMKLKILLFLDMESVSIVNSRQNKNKITLIKPYDFQDKPIHSL